MTNQASNTVYKITVWSGGTNYNTQEQSGGVNFFDYTEAEEALETWKELIQEGYLGARITVQKFKKDVSDAIAEYGIGFSWCQPPSQLPKYVQKRVLNLLEAAEDNDELFEWLANGPDSIEFLFYRPSTSGDRSRPAVTKN